MGIKKRMRNTIDEHSDVSGLLDAWRQHLLSDRAPSTAYRYISVIRRFLSWYEAEEHQPLDVQALTPIILVGYRNALQRSESTSTVNTHVSALRAWCRWLVEQEFIPIDPAARLKLVSRQSPLAPKALKEAEVNALLRAAARSRHTLRDIAILQMLLQTGVRIGECAALTWGDFTFGEKSGWVNIRAGKGNKSRSVPLNASVRQALASYVAPLLNVEPTPKAVAATWAQKENARFTPLWGSQKGDRLSVSAMARMIDELVRDCAARKLVPPETSAHTLRHTFAAHYLEAHPGDLIGLASVLGHSSLDTTRIYVQPTAEALAERIEAISLNAYE